MDPIILSRLQFALATIVHFFFVPLTIGLGFFIAIMETRYVRTGDEQYKLQAKFWGKIFLINFVLGVVTGIALEFQFGTNWAIYSKYVGDIFGSLLAIEATLAFFLESTFIAIWAFGWDKIPKKLHCVSIWLVAFASTISALWILLASGFMQNPVGYQQPVQDGVARLSSFWEVLTNTYGWHMYFHTVCGAFLLAGFLVMGVSAWHLYFGQNKDFFHTSFKLGSCFAVCFAILTALAGHQLGQVTAEKQPSKFAALESVWETEPNTPMYLIVVPKFTNEEGNLVQALPIPGFLSFLATNSFKETIPGMKSIKPEDRPLVWPIFISFRLMVTFGCIMLAVAVLTAIFRKIVPSFGWGLWIYVILIPLPYITLELGWLVTELGRQPWIVYGLLRTADAGSPAVEWYQVLGTFIAMALIYALISITGFVMMIRAALKGPDNMTEHYA
ncbi:MAG: cytochrome ubiquinol oxidase subunit I [Deltaproteobacteria bacterium]|jgi:cytochrome d ubiquinol oxidase subunit I|nr:cytochrome ubiquinol oxidase subunit I [Deltaproteobacteria bacterium]